MHTYISALRAIVPPYSAPIDPAEPGWLEVCLTDVLQKMGYIDAHEPNADPAKLDLYRRVMQSVVVAVVNYWPVSNRNGFAGRHTATLINPQHFRVHNSKR